MLGCSPFLTLKILQQVNPTIDVERLTRIQIGFVGSSFEWERSLISYMIHLAFSVVIETPATLPAEHA